MELPLLFYDVEQHTFPEQREDATLALLDHAGQQFDIVTHNAAIQNRQFYRLLPEDHEATILNFDEYLDAGLQANGFEPLAQLGSEASAANFTLESALGSNVIRITAAALLRFENMAALTERKIDLLGLARDLLNDQIPTDKQQKLWDRYPDGDILQFVREMAQQYIVDVLPTVDSVFGRQTPINTARRPHLAHNRRPFTDVTAQTEALALDVDYFLQPEHIPNVTADKVVELLSSYHQQRLGYWNQSVDRLQRQVERVWPARIRDQLGDTFVAANRGAALAIDALPLDQLVSVEAQRPTKADAREANSRQIWPSRRQREAGRAAISDIRDAHSKHLHGKH